jgi:hypothetical protein
LGGGGATLRRHDREEFWHVQAQTCATNKSAVCIQSPVEGDRCHVPRPAQDAIEFEAGHSACTAEPAERRHDCHRHAAKDDAIQVWCERVSAATKRLWSYMRVNQPTYEAKKPVALSDLIEAVAEAALPL